MDEIPVSTVTTPEEFVATAARIGREVLAVHADEVDSESRFPAESIQAMRDAGMLGALVPTELGGLGLSIDTVSRAVTELGKHCSSSAMVYAMHLIQVACLVEHGTTPALRDYTSEVARAGLLLASATSEVGIGGDVRSSSCAVETIGEKISLSKQAPVISYGQHADGILATARRTPDSPPSDQVLVVCRGGSFDLEPTSTWDALGFRGTCSLGFVLSVHGHVDDVLPVPYGDISSQTMLPVSHVLWSSLWLGIASAAESKARAFIQAAARRAPSVTPPGAVRLAELTAVLHQFIDLVEGGRRRYAVTLDDPSAATTISFAIAMNTLKISASTLVVDVVQRSLLVCGMAGYANRSPFTLGRLLRDSYGAQLMVNNDRIHANNSHLLLIHRGDGR
jgi:acyl-CoA dehydrogenase